MSSAIVECLFLLVLLYLAIVDVRNRVVPGVGIVAIAAFRAADLMLGSLLGTPSVFGSVGLVGSLVGAVCVGGFCWLTARIASGMAGEDAFGEGDIAIMTVLGFCFGTAGGFRLLLLACVLAVVHACGSWCVHAIRRATRRGNGMMGTCKGWNSTFPFIPFTACAAFVMILH